MNAALFRLMLPLFGVMACLGAPAMAQKAGNTPLKIEIDSDISFGTAAHDSRGGGSIELDPVTGTRRATGGLVVVGGNYFTGRARITGTPFSRVLVTLPDRITMRARQGTKAVAALFSAKVPPVITLDAMGQYSFTFAGRFDVDELEVGDFKGNFAITADYE